MWHEGGADTWSVVDSRSSGQQRLTTDRRPTTVVIWVRSGALPVALTSFTQTRRADGTPHYFQNGMHSCILPTQCVDGHWTAMFVVAAMRNTSAVWWTRAVAVKHHHHHHHHHDRCGAASRKEEGVAAGCSRRKEQTTTVIRTHVKLWIHQTVRSRRLLVVVRNHASAIIRMNWTLLTFTSAYVVH